MISKPNLQRALVLTSMILTFFVVTPAANAAVTSSAITSPTDRFIATYDDDSGAGSMTVTGSAVAGPGDKVDILCIQGVTVKTFATAVPVVGGEFSVTASLSPLKYRTCVLHAVPAGTTPTDFSSFPGPVIGITSTFTYLASGVLWDYYVWPAQFSGNFDYDSAGRCGVDDSYLFDAANSYNLSAVVFYCNQWLDKRNASPTASSIAVDGQNAYAAGAIGNGFSTTPGFQTITWSFSQAPNGDGRIVETTPIMFCPNNPAPPLTAVNCPSLTDSGVRINRTIDQDHDGLVAVVNDDVVSTDGAAHTVSLSYRQSYCLGRPGCTPTPQFTFPGQAPVTNPANGDVLSTSLPAAGTIFASNPTLADGDVTGGRGALTYFPAADSATAYDARDFELNYNNRSVPATGSLHIAAIFSQSFAQAQLDGLVAEAVKRITPQPTFGAAVKAKASYDKKKKKTILSTGQSVNCPATGQPCAITASFSTKVLLPKKKHSKKKRYKTYKFGSIKLTGIPGSVTPVTFILSKTGSKLLQTYKKLKFNFTFAVTAGPNASANLTSVATVKAPKLPKPKPKRRKH